MDSVAGRIKRKEVYNEKTGYKLAMFHLEEATAVVIPMMGPGEPIE